MKRVCVWIMIGGLILWLPSGAGGSNCQVEPSDPGSEVGLVRHLSVDCTEREREARAVDATQLLQAFREGKGIDLVGVVIRGDLSLDMLAVDRLPPELEGMKELQGLEVRMIHGPVKIINSVVRGTIKYGSRQGLLVVQGPVSFNGSRFEQVVDLSRSVFLQPVTLSGAQFLRESYFVQGRFLRGLYAENTMFGPHTRFHRSIFQGPVTFRQSRFNGLAEFLEVTFEKDADLSHSYFTLGTGFSGSRFQGRADFSDVTFEHEAFFTFTLFDGDVYFPGARFQSTADFSDASFKGRDDFSKAHFNQKPQFTGAAKPATVQAAQEGENQVVHYAVGFTLLAFIALLGVYLIRSR